MQQGKAQLRAGVEIGVVVGDIKRVLFESNLSVMHRKGLVDRIRGGISGLAILTRLADEETGQVLPDTRALVYLLSENVQNGKLKQAAIQAEQLALRYQPALPRARKDRKMAAALHGRYCAGCHDEPDLDKERPAFNLFSLARKTSGSEFFARLFVGVRGDRTTGIDNPLANNELAALVDYYKNGR